MTSNSTARLHPKDSTKQYRHLATLTSTPISMVTPIAQRCFIIAKWEISPAVLKTATVVETIPIVYKLIVDISRIRCYQSRFNYAFSAFATSLAAVNVIILLRGRRKLKQNDPRPLFKKFRSTSLTVFSSVKFFLESQTVVALVQQRFCAANSIALLRHNVCTS